MIDLLCVGEALAVGVLPQGDPLRELQIGVGGAELNVALALAHAGRTVQFASRLGDDPFGRLISQTLRDAKIDAVIEQDAVARTGFYLREQRATGRSVSYYRAGSAGSRLPAAASLRAALRGARRLHLTGITAALRRGNGRAISRLIQRARAAGCLVSFDVNFRSALWPAELAAPVLASLADAADLVFVGADEAEELWGVRDADELRHRLAAQELVYKDGDRLRVAVARGDELQHFALTSIEVVDSVGAGDAFAAGYLHAALNTAPPAEQVAVAHAFASEVMSSARDALTKDAVNAALSARAGARLLT